ncbi:hypothetical protein [Methylorubrum extorquens]|uniref:Uncharacterized protein n=1 Tax=Methylorubrum extorquens (strain ATCC 14718 / DSM 1338 / JCM 2805 / NCIMB 9133 / AM1) TaxID=272630 RepID=C5ASK6_METEA|nr:hypothetical protein [Methylorubrum extorquens]ACS40447.1 Hypothetical protein MexAM1_META1p2680 [Methylorubrum extorquens AM1]MCP1541407.1 hypothetical protein [Methylorubrum extorquens]MCP1586057.1 hypothetical protein [Methylorubrum extorquens]
MTQLELFPVQSDPLAPADPPALSELTEAQRARAGRRLAYVQALEGLPAGACGADAVPAAFAAVGREVDDVKWPSLRQVRRWQRLLRTSGGQVAALADRRRSVPARPRWAGWIGSVADEAAAQARLRPARSLSLLTQAALQRCREEALARGCAPDQVPAPGTLRRMIRARMRPPARGSAAPARQVFRFLHMSSGHPLGEVVVGEETLDIALPELDTDRVHLLTARDAYSGVTVAARLSTTEPDGDAVLGLFGARPAAATPEPLGVARLCLGLPDALLLDHAPRFRSESVLRSAAALGIELRFGPAASAGGAAPAAGLGQWLAATGAAVATADGLMAAVQDWLSRHDLGRSRRDGRTPLDRWQEGVTRYPIRLGAAAAPARMPGAGAGA